MEYTPGILDQAVTRTSRSLVLRGLLSLAVGILIVTRPMAGVAAFALVIALWALFAGITDVVHANDLRGIAPHWWVMLLSGIVSIVFGVAALYYYPTLSLAFAVVWVSWWLVIGGALGIYVAAQERRFGLSYGWTMAWGALAAIAGIVALIYPPVTLAALLGFIAVFAIIAGIVLLVAAFRLRQARRDVEEAVRRAPTA
ncbi:MAG: HdeD family acid-resistance protein [Gemmatimonadaceae bacterium]